MLITLLGTGFLVGNGACSAAAVYLSPWLWRQYRMGQIRKRVRDNRLLALTYDDGPSPTLTPRLLDLLQAYDVRATFFLLGRESQKYPDVVERIVQDGHQIGCHSSEHL